MGILFIQSRESRFQRDKTFTELVALLIKHRLDLNGRESFVFTLIAR
jgi:hypothetical protein